MATRRYSRRDAVRVAALGTLVSSAIDLVARAAPALATDPAPRNVYVYDRIIVIRAASTEASEQTLWATIMRVDDKLANPIDRYYLWQSTHDYPILRLYTAREIEGPWTEQQPCALPHAPSGWDPGHFQAPDVVWDPAGRRFLATPHSKTAKVQNSFLISSPDGHSWSFLDPAQQPMVANGPSGAFDSYAIDYGRFLRDPYGNLARHNGEVVWYYRGTHRGVAGNESYAIGAATSADLLNWKKVPGPILEAPTRPLCAIGTAVRSGGSITIYWTNVVPLGPDTSRTMYKLVSKGSDPLVWGEGPGVPIYQSPDLFCDGGSWIVDAATGTDYLAFCAEIQFEPAPQFAIKLLKAPLGAVGG